MSCTDWSVLKIMTTNATNVMLQVPELQMVHIGSSCIVIMSVVTNMLVCLAHELASYGIYKPMSTL